MKDLFGQNYYELLEISPEASMDALRQAIGRTREFWADESGPSYSLLAPEERERLLVRIADAAKTLLDPEARRRYHEAAGLPAVAAETAPLVSVPGPPSAPPVIASPPTPPVPETSKRTFPTPTRRPLPTLKANLRPFKSPLVARPTQEIRPPSVSKMARQTPSPPVPAPLPAASVPEVPVQRPDPVEFFQSENDCTGENLKRYREACGVELAQIAKQTRISRTHLENVEAGRFDLLPAPVYVRGFLEAYCKQLGLDAPLVTAGYLRKFSTFKRIEGQE